MYFFFSDKINMKSRIKNLYLNNLNLIKENIKDTFLVLTKTIVHAGNLTGYIYKEES